MSVTACLVTRNHAQSVGRAVRSMAGVADEVLVVDTGSSDTTVEVAQEFGAVVHNFPWGDDFSAPLNFALDRAKGDWAFLLNPDEELDPAGGPALKSAVADPLAFGIKVRVQQELRADLVGYGTRDWQLRLFRRDPAVRYRGRVHPAFDPPLEELAAARGRTIGTAEATVHRYAFLSQPTPEKLRWVTSLLRAELADRPDRLGTRIELGRNLLWLNDPAGHDVLAEAAAAVAQAADRPLPPAPEVGLLLEYLLAVPPDASKSPIGRDQARELAARWFPGTPPVVWALAGERFAAGDHAGAAPLLEKLLAMGRAGGYDPAGGFDPDIIGPGALMNLGACHLHLGAWDKAQACFGPLLNHPEHGPRARQFFGHAEQRRKA